MDRETLEIKVRDYLKTDNKEATLIVDKAITGGEIISSEQFDDWFSNRFVPNVVFIDEDGYAKMCIDALKILKGTVASDYGSSRQRDFGQLWADMTRGYLAEYAFVKFLQDIWGAKASLGHEKGELAEYLPMDIHMIQKEGESSLREPKIKIGIKGTKWNGIWFDIPGKQFSHSDIHVMVKVGTGRDHLFAYFKHISVFKDKVLKKGVEMGALNQSEADDLYNNLPLFSPIPAYIAGFALGNSSVYKDLSYAGKCGRKNYNITGWNGEIKSGDLELIKEKEKIQGKVRFEGIGEFAHDSGYLFNVGNLLWRKDDWEKYVINPM